MLVVGPPNGMLPNNLSVLESMTFTLSVAESNTNTVVLSGDVAIRPGAVPAAISEARGSVSVLASMMTTPAADDRLEMPCEAKTRVVSPLGGLVIFGAGLQETKLKVIANSADKRLALFKLQAPNCRKMIDLCVK
jgi:hypothetical protein